MKKKQIAYVAMKGGALNNTQAHIAAIELERIQASHGCIKPQIVVDESRPENSPLHNHFTWNDVEAAEKCRLDEARQIIRSVRILWDVSIPASEQPEIRAFVNVRAHDTEHLFEGQAYISTQRAIIDEDYKQQVINKAMAELRLWKHRYEDYKEFFGRIFDEINKLPSK